MMRVRTLTARGREICRRVDESVLREVFAKVFAKVFTNAVDKVFAIDHRIDGGATLGGGTNMIKGDMNNSTVSENEYGT